MSLTINSTVPDLKLCIKRSYKESKPEKLDPGELAWCEPSMTLYVGLEDGTPCPIAGKGSIF